MSQTPEAYTINNEQEAIRELEIMRRCFKSFSVQFQALSMAIEALQMVKEMKEIERGEHG